MKSAEKRIEELKEQINALRAKYQSEIESAYERGMRDGIELLHEQEIGKGKI